MPGRKRRSNWRDKMPPAFVAIAEFNSQLEKRWTDIVGRRGKEVTRLKKASDAEKQSANQKFEAECSTFLESVSQGVLQLQAQYPDMPGNALAFSHFSESPIPEDRGLAEWFHSERHGESLRTAEQLEQSGDFAALQRIQRTEQDLWRAAHKRGPIKPFQGDEVHRSLLQQLIWFEPIDNPLTAEERADCFDDLCACGNTHNADALKKQYLRLKKELSAAERRPEAR